MCARRCTRLHDIGLGDDQRRRGEVEAADLGRHGDELAAAPQYLDRGVRNTPSPLPWRGADRRFRGRR